MKSQITALAVLAAVLAGSGLAALRSRPVVYAAHKSGRHNNFVQPRARPLGVIDFTGDGRVYLTITSWKDWTSAQASGRGKLHVRSCWGSCFKYKTERAVIRLYRVRKHKGHSYFTRLAYKVAHKLGGVGSRTLKFHSRGSPAWRLLGTFVIR